MTLNDEIQINYLKLAVKCDKSLSEAINSDDYEFSIKTITEQEFKIMVRLLQNKMVDYFKKNEKYQRRFKRRLY